MPEFSPNIFLTAFRSLTDLTFETQMQSMSLFKQQFISVMSLGVKHSKIKEKLENLLYNN